MFALVRRAASLPARRSLASLQVRCAGSERSALPDAGAIRLDELRRTVEGGASRLGKGERGASVVEMRSFWRDAGAAEGRVREELAERAASQGGVWADPPTLADRLRELQFMVPPLPRARLLARFPDGLSYHPLELRRKLEGVASCLPGVNVLQMIARRPGLLRRSEANLAERIGNIVALLPRDDMAHVLAAAPGLIEVSPPELLARAQAMRTSYSTETIAGWDRAKAVRMLQRSSRLLQRLAHLDGLDPGLRMRHADSRFLSMPQPTYERTFETKKRPRWKKRPGALGGPTPRSRTLARAEEVPTSGVNLFHWGAEQRERWIGRRHAEEEQDRRTRPARQAALKHDRALRGLPP